MDRFLEMQTFATVVESGSFTRAAEQLGLSKPAVSRHVDALESRLGVRLLHRTTRRLSLTAEGEVFHARCKDVLASLAEAENEATMHAAAAHGLLRINAPVTFGVRYLSELWGSFLQTHPQVELDVTLSDRIVDLVEEGFDLAIRIAMLSDSSMVGRKLATTRMVLCATPGYLAQHGNPEHPGELSEHATIGYSYWPTRDEWQFQHNNETIRVQTRPGARSNNGETCMALALADQGIILQPSFLVADEIAAGRLKELLPEYDPGTIGIYAVFPTRKHLPPKVRALINFLRTELPRHLPDL